MARAVLFGAFVMMVAPRAAHILVADDDAAMRGVIADALRRDGHEITLVKDGGELLVQIAKLVGADARSRIDLIVTDVRMPICGGLDIVKGVRDSTWNLPIVVMSAFGGPYTRARAAALGAVFLDKPFKMAALRELVRDLLADERIPLP
jgi:CheY-like chemotaxis protein